MARRRLAPVDPGSLAAPVVEPAGSVPRAERPFASAPIARVAAEAAAGAALEEMAESLRAAREEGRLVLDLPLEQIATDHLVRDRIAAAEDEEMATLKTSIQLHGQRTPIEVMPLDPEPGALPYGLVSGWRRMAAIGSLHAETKEARFTTVRALVLRPESAEAAYVAMVEENEVRVGLSQYERARIAARATERGVFPDVETALRTFFGDASKAKLSRIRTFLQIYAALDPILRFPQAIPERLGLRLAKWLPSDGMRIAEALAAAEATTPAEEIGLLERLAAAAPQAAANAPASRELRPGIRMDVARRKGAWTVLLTGEGVTPEFAETIASLLSQSENA